MTEVERFAAQAFNLPRIADAAGVPLSTLEGWISVGTADHTSLEAGVVAALRRGYVASTAELTECLRDSALGKEQGENEPKRDWRAAAFLLERVHGYLKPKEQAEVATEIDGEDGWAQLALALTEPKPTEPQSGEQG
jgi:hypothetical protein